MCPIKRRRAKDRNDPWLTNEIIDLIQAKNLAWKKAKRTQDPDDRERARVLRNRTKHVIRQAKSNFVQDYLDNDQISTKKFWEKINYIMPSNDRQCIIKLVDQDSREPVTDNDLASYVNEFFVNIGPKLSESFLTEWTDNLTNNCEFVMPDLKVDILTLGKIIDDIGIHKSSTT